ncbi:hypothetical protein [Pseudonocardia sp. NPDC049635]|uniref:hypothetical protein n=1 Tax=Pseudonocardia sp. NPDC049635 TaxID=3155506 RepID=UPI0033D2FCDC
MSVFEEPTEGERRVWRVRDLIRSLATEWFSTGEVGELAGDTPVPRAVPADPLDGLRTAVLIQQVAAGQAREYALEARGAGVSWVEVGAVLGFEGLDEPGVSAFEHVAERGVRTGVRRESVSWTCASCRTRVTDTGPYNGHPSDVESGHADACARHRGEIAVWEQGAGWAAR